MAEQGRELAHETFALELESGVTVRGDVRLQPDGLRKPVIVLLHGFKGFKDWGMFPYAAERLAIDGGFGVVTFNFSHNGVAERDFDELDKFGRNTHTLELRDIGAVMAALKNAALPLSDQLDPGQAVLVGHSRGGGDAVLYAAEHPDEAKGIVSWNGIADCNLFPAEFRELVMREGVGYVANARTKQDMPISKAFFEDLALNESRYDIVARAAALPPTMRALFLQGDADSPRLVDGFRRLQEAAPQHEYVTMEGVDHTFGARHPFGGTTEELERAIELTVAFARKAFNIVGVRIHE